MPRKLPSREEKKARKDARGSRFDDFHAVAAEMAEEKAKKGAIPAQAGEGIAVEAYDDVDAALAICAEEEIEEAKRLAAGKVFPKMLDDDEKADEGEGDEVEDDVCDEAAGTSAGAGAQIKPVKKAKKTKEQVRKNRDNENQKRDAAAREQDKLSKMPLEEYDLYSAKFHDDQENNVRIQKTPRWSQFAKGRLLDAVREVKPLRIIIFTPDILFAPL